MSEILDRVWQVLKFDIHTDMVRMLKILQTIEEFENTLVVDTGDNNKVLIEVRVWDLDNRVISQIIYFEPNNPNPVTPVGPVLYADSTKQLADILARLDNLLTRWPASLGTGVATSGSLPVVIRNSTLDVRSALNRQWRLQYIENATFTNTEIILAGSVYNMGVTNVTVQGTTIPPGLIVEVPIMGIDDRLNINTVTINATGGKVLFNYITA
jgi:hypothetical protein